MAKPKLENVYSHLNALHVVNSVLAPFSFLLMRLSTVNASESCFFTVDYLFVYAFVDFSAAVSTFI